MTDTIPVLLDTDIGSDIDDAVALAYLLRQPRCELVGITTVTGNVAKRAALVQVLCETAGRNDIPIHCGASDVMGNGPGQLEAPQYESIRVLPHRVDWDENTALGFMRDVISSRPGEITLVSIGPMTNIAQLFMTCPDIGGMLKGWVSMGGEFDEPKQRYADWNFACDPLAGATASRLFTGRHAHVGLNVTLKCRMPADEVRRRFTGPLLDLVLRMAGSWFERHDSIVFHDPLAAGLIFEPGLCRFERGQVEVDQVTGRTQFTPSPEGSDEVPVSVDIQRFL